MRTDDFTLTHGDAARDLAEVFAEACLYDQTLDFTQLAFALHPRGVGMQLAKRLHIGRHPGKAVRGELFLFEKGCAHAAFLAHFFGDSSTGMAEEGFSAGKGLGGEREEFGRREGNGRN